MTFGSIKGIKDGFHIRGLLAGFFHKYCPDFKDNIGILNTPVILVTKGDKITNWTYSINEELKLKSGEKSRWMKGLGSWDADDLKYIISQDGIDKMIEMLNFNDSQIIDDWLGNNSEPRKKYILQNDFSIAKL